MESDITLKTGSVLKADPQEEPDPIPDLTLQKKNSFLKISKLLKEVKIMVCLLISHS